MTVREPRVSTTGSDLMMAASSAMRIVPNDSTIVTSAGRPLGIIATAIATADLNASSAGSSACRKASRKAETAMVSTTTTSRRPRISICFTRFVLATLVSDTRRLILPISASSPVATTTPMPWPADTVVALKSMHLRSPRPDASWTALRFLEIGTDSPVSIASSTCRLVTSITRMSAGMRSPDLTMTMSPGTSSSAGTVKRLPPRTTLADAESMALMASAAFSALPSWSRPMEMLMTTTARMSAISIHCCSAATMIHDDRRIQIMTLFICSHSFTKKEGFLGGVSAFLPYCSKRRATSSFVRPSRLLLSLASTSSECSNECQKTSFTLTAVASGGGGMAARPSP
mmetsp:Transcript_41040/g.122536  ORF Transcript_41040/g.122536 Transcript_41040/m.122536 type:complete len:344 (+) Transcript_41040:1160-2191(+)